MRPRVPVTRQARPNRAGRPVGDLLGREQLVQRAQAALCDRLAHMRMVQHDEVIARAEIGDGMRLESLERLPVPREGYAVTRGVEPPGGGCQGVSTARMIPGQTAIADHGASRYSAMAPAATSASIRSSG